ncbi:hypothetical protein [Prauserella flavalba]|uniref:hypothetical protein n=1 Tax=Prauserella flavalba TaxID=1477506 RepID=UPI0036EC3DE2
MPEPEETPATPTRLPVSRRELALLLVLVLAAACVVTGVSMLSVAVAWILGGVLLAAIGGLFLIDDGERA